MGPRVLHGPHHSAHRSTTTGTVRDLSMTSVAKVASVTSLTAASLTAPLTGGRRARALLASARMDAPAGIDEVHVSTWMASRVGARIPLTYELIAGGRSNLTFLVTDATGRRFALRRPPVSHVLPTAHDMVREHTVISALAPTGVPVPAALALCTDDAVNGAPFYVMSFVEGHVLRDAAQAERELDPAARSRVGGELATTLAALHAVDPA